MISPKATAAILKNAQKMPFCQRKKLNPMIYVF